MTKFLGAAMAPNLADARLAPPLDLELIAQRILKLAEVATLEHLELLMNSQARQILDLAREADAA
jgi:hypothetical protein